MALSNKEKIQEAIDLAWRYGDIEGSHHRKWVIDQMVRVLTGDKYEEWVDKYEDGGEYEWDEGIPP